MFCGNLVYSKENEKAYEEGMALAKQLEDDPTLGASTYLKALEHKNKLLKKDEDQFVRSNIYDEEVDWYEIKSDIWQSPEAREKAVESIMKVEQQKYEDSKTFGVQFDPVQGKFVEMASENFDAKAKKEAQDFIVEQSKEKKREETGVSADLQGKAEQIYSELRNQIKAAPEKKEKPEKKQTKAKRIQHEDIFEEYHERALEKKEAEVAGKGPNVFDDELYPLDENTPMCLSMWQPWASLVVHGFKRFEGRAWSTPFRGPLWIAAGSREPVPEEVAAVEESYRRLYKGRDMPSFPERYPTSSLLGVVDLQTVLSARNYKEAIREEFREENDSDYLFVLRNPRKLTYPVKMSGKPNIFEIDPDLVSAVTRTLRKVPSAKWFPYIAKELKVASSLQGPGVQSAQAVVKCLRNEIKSKFMLLQMEEAETNLRDLLVFIRETVKDDELVEGPSGKKEFKIQSATRGSERLVHLFQKILGGMLGFSKDEVIESIPMKFDVIWFSENVSEFEIPSKYFMVLSIGARNMMQVGKENLKVNLDSGHLVYRKNIMECSIRYIKTMKENVNALLPEFFKDAPYLAVLLCFYR